MVSTKEQIIDNLVLPSLKALAATPEMQVKLYPSFCCPLEELLDDAEHALRSLLSMYPETLSEEQIHAVNLMLAQIANMEETDLECYGLDGDTEKLGNQNWCLLRSVAGNTIKSLGYEIQPPIPAKEVAKRWVGPS